MYALSLTRFSGHSQLGILGNKGVVANAGIKTTISGAVSLVGRAPRVIYTIEPQRPGEDGTAAATRALQELHTHNLRYVDCWTLDAFYARAGMLNLALEQHKDVVVKVRQQDRHLVRDAEGIFVKQAPVY